MNEKTKPIRILDLFSGIGGFAVAAEIAKHDGLNSSKGRDRGSEPDTGRQEKQSGIEQSSGSDCESDLRQIMGDTEHAGLHAAQVAGSHPERNDRGEAGTESGREPARPSDGQLENTNGGRRGEREPKGESVCWTRPANQGDEQKAEPSLGVLIDGIPSTVVGTWPQVHNRVAQLKAAGNAIVPFNAAIMLHAILKAINGNQPQ